MRTSNLFLFPPYVKHGTKQLTHLARLSTSYTPVEKSPPSRGTTTVSGEELIWGCAAGSSSVKLGEGAVSGEVEEVGGVFSLVSTLYPDEED